MAPPRQPLSDAQRRAAYERAARKARSTGMAEQAAGRIQPASLCFERAVYYESMAAGLGKRREARP